MLIIEVYHEASPPQLIGTVQTSIGEIFGARQKGVDKEIMDKKNKSKGTLIMKC